MKANRKIKWLILSLCAVVMVAWGVLMAVLFGGEGKEDKASTPTPIMKVEVTATPTPIEKVTVWCKSERIFKMGSSEAPRKYKYDECGRCIETTGGIFGNDEDEVVKYSYGENGLVTAVKERKQQSAYFASGLKEYDQVLTQVYGDDDRLMRTSERTVFKSGDISVDTTETVYGEDGRYTVEQTRYDVSGRIVWSERSQYDSEHYLLKREQKLPVAEGSAELEWVLLGWCDCDEEGRVVREYYRTSPEAEAMVVREVEYHEGGTRTERTLSGDRLEFRYVIDYDEKGREVVKVFTEDGQGTLRTEMTYYEKAEGTIVLTRDVHQDAPDDVQLVFVDTNGKNLLACDFTEYADKKLQYEASRDEQGRLIRLSINGFVHEYKYDSYGNCILETLREPSGQEELVIEGRYTRLELTKEEAEIYEKYRDWPDRAYSWVLHMS